MAILTVAESKDYLNIDPLDSTYDSELQGFLDSATAIIEQIIGGPVENRTVTETVEPVDCGRALILRAKAVNTVTSITSNGTSLVITDLYVGPGRVLRRVTGLPWYPTWPPLVVTFTAGLGVTAPANVKLAAKIIVAHLWETQQGSSGGGTPSPSSELPPAGMGYAIPNRALELLSPYTSESGLG